MSKSRLVVAFSTVFGILVGCGQAFAQRDGMPVGYPQSLESDLQSLLGRLRDGGPSPQLLVQVSSTYFDLADDLLTDEASRRVAYEAGAKAARQAFELDEFNADAHFFHAANLGSAERLKGIANAGMVLKDVMHCAMRAIELNPKHAQALQMMGGLLMELPWFLGGDEKKAQAYLERAIAADGNFTNARVLIAKLYKKQGRIDDAKQQLEAVIRAGNPHYRFAWERTYKPEAERMLKEIMEPAPLKREKLQLCSYSAPRQTGGLLTGFYRQVQQKRPSQKLARGSFFIPPVRVKLSTLKIICLWSTRKDTAKP